MIFHFYCFIYIFHVLFVLTPSCIICSRITLICTYSPTLICVYSAYTLSVSKRMFNSISSFQPHDCRDLDKELQSIGCIRMPVGNKSILNRSCSQLQRHPQDIPIQRLNISWERTWVYVTVGSLARKVCRKSVASPDAVVNRE